MHKKVSGIIVLFLLLAVCSSSVWGQLGVRTGLKAGYNYSSLRGVFDDKAESRNSFTGGVSMELNLLLISIQADLMFSPRGAAFSGGEDVNFTWLSLPVVAKVKFFPVLLRPYILAGPEFNYLLSAKIDGKDSKNDFSSRSVSAVAGFGLELSIFGKAAYAEARYCHGLSDISNVPGIEYRDKTYQVLCGFLF